MSAEAISTEQVFQAMVTRFDAAAAANLSAVYQFELSGDDGGTWQVRINEGTCTVEQGAPLPASIYVLMDASDYVQMILGSLNSQMAFMQGKLKIKGDIDLALRMQQIFPAA